MLPHIGKCSSPGGNEDQTGTIILFPVDRVLSMEILSSLIMSKKRLLPALVNSLRDSICFPSMSNRFMFLIFMVHFYCTEDVPLFAGVNVVAEEELGDHFRCQLLQVDLESSQHCFHPSLGGIERLHLLQQPEIFGHRVCPAWQYTRLQNKNSRMMVVVMACWAVSRNYFLKRNM